jgi:hypothetical protein
MNLKQKAADLKLSSHAMAHYLGVPFNTYHKWAVGERSLDAAPRRLLEVLAMIETQAPALHTSLIDAARATERATLRDKPGKGAPKVEKPASAPPEPFVHVVQALPDWMRHAV